MSLGRKRKQSPVVLSFEEEGTRFAFERPASLSPFMVNVVSTAYLLYRGEELNEYLLSLQVNPPRKSLGPSHRLQAQVDEEFDELDSSQESFPQVIQPIEKSAKKSKAVSSSTYLEIERKKLIRSLYFSFLPLSELPPPPSPSLLLLILPSSHPQSHPPPSFPIHHPDPLH